MSGRAKGSSLQLTDRVAGGLRAAASGERNCERSVIHIVWLDSYDWLHKLMYSCNS